MGRGVVSCAIVLCNEKTSPPLMSSAKTSRRLNTLSGTLFDEAFFVRAILSCALWEGPGNESIRREQRSKAENAGSCERANNALTLAALVSYFKRSRASMQTCRLLADSAPFLLSRCHIRRGCFFFLRAESGSDFSVSFPFASDARRSPSPRPASLSKPLAKARK